jgi:uncharacterized iron-regulated membrane protein
LSLGWLLAIAALLGGLLTIAKPLDRWAHPHLFVQQAAGSQRPDVTLEHLSQQLRREFGDKASYTFRPPRQTTDTLWVYVRGTWEGMVFYDAATGRELGRRGEHEGFYNLLFELHSSLLLGEAGKAALTISAFAYLLLLLSGLVLWWPVRWPPSFKIRWNARQTRLLFDLHNVGGALLGVVLAVSVATGAYMAWPPLRVLVSGIVGQTPFAPPRVPHFSADTAKPLDELVGTARSVFPDGMVGYVQVPAEGTHPLRVRLKLPDDPHPNGLTSVWLDPTTGAVLAAHRWSALDAGHKAIAVMYPLHTGELGGLLYTAVVGILGLCLGLLAITGIWLWWKRRPGRRALAASRSVSSPTYSD